MNSQFFPYQKEYDNCLFRSVNHEMYLQLLQKSRLSACDEKRCYESIKSKHWI